MDFPRLDLTQLIDEGRKALREEDYHRAVLIFRESIRRAPFRQDLKEGLAMAVEGTLIQGEADQRPAQSSTLTALHGQVHAAPAEFAAPAEPVLPSPKAPPATPRAAGRSLEGKVPVHSTSTDRNRKAFGGGGPAAAARPQHGSSKPSHFEKRHRRGPLSALLLGAVVGLVLIGSVVGVFYYYLAPLVSTGKEGREAAISRAQIESILEQANNYRQKGDYALAIAQLETLPESPERSRKLAETYMAQGNLNSEQKPPQIESAIEAYNNAVRYEPDNAEYGYALGMAYLALSREKKADKTNAEKYLDLARQTFQAVLDRHPDHVGSLDGLSRVAVLQRDNVTAANAWRHIIQVAPDSYEAERARNNLKSLNYKF